MDVRPDAAEARHRRDVVAEGLAYPVASASAVLRYWPTCPSVTSPPPSASPRGRSSRTCIAAWPPETGLIEELR